MELEDIWLHQLRIDRASQALADDANAWPTTDQDGQLDLVALKGATFSEMNEQAERQTLVAIVAAAEAAIQADLAVILAHQSDEIRRRVAVLPKKKGSPDLGAVVGVWAKDGDAGLQAAAATFQELHRFRHWLAHGRRWDRPGAMDLRTAWSSIRVLFQVLRLQEPVRPASWLRT